MSYPYFFLNENTVKNNSIILSGYDFNHLVKVLRAKEGEHVDISDNCATRYKTIVSDIKKECAVLSVIDSYPIKKRVPQIKLFLCILKKEAMEIAIQKTVETGIDSITPVISRRTVSEFKDNYKINKKLQRWQQIAIEASKQCKRDFICKINNQQNIETLKTEDLDILFVATEKTNPSEEKENYYAKLADILSTEKLKNYKNIAYIIGPEGGFEDYEKEKLINNCAVPFNFGKNIFRSETAAIYFMCILDYLIKSSGI